MLLITRAFLFFSTTDKTKKKSDISKTKYEINNICCLFCFFVCKNL